MTAEQTSYLCLNALAALMVLLIIVLCWVRVYRDDFRDIGRCLCLCVRWGPGAP